MKKTFNNLYKINKKAIYSVIVIHLFFILLLAFQFKFFKQPKKHNLIVSNIIEKQKPKPKIFENSSQIKKTPIKKNTDQKNKIPMKNKTIVKPKNYENLLEKLEKQINNLDKKQETKIIKEDLLIPKNVKILNIDKIIENSQENSLSKIKELLIKELQDNLKLPEYGEVKVSFTIHTNGEIKNITILEHQSYENQKYLKNSLSELSFKSINKMFDEPQNFVVTFKNE